MPIRTVKGLYKKREKINSLAKKYGFEHVEIRPPVPYSQFDRRKLQLNLIVSISNPDDTSSVSQLGFERALKKLLGSKFSVQVKNDLEVDMSKYEFDRITYGPLLRAAVPLDALKPDVSLEEQWKEKELKNELSSSISPLRSEKLLATSAEKIMTPLSPSPSGTKSQKQEPTIAIIRQVS